MFLRYPWVLQVLKLKMSQISRQNNPILQKKMSGVDKVMNFKNVSRPNKEIK